jgi:hypothetical protein
MELNRAFYKSFNAFIGAIFVAVEKARILQRLCAISRF